MINVLTCLFLFVFIKRDERERIQLQKITDNTVAIRSAIDSGATSSSAGGLAAAAAIGPANADEMMKQLVRVRKKVETMEEAFQSRLSVLANEVIIDK